MMDNFKEDIVARRKTFLQNLLYILSWVAVVFFGLYAYLLLQTLFMEFNVAALISMVINAALAVLIYLNKDKLKLEYEYTFTNGSLDFAQVYRSVKRKELGSMNVKNVLACGHVAHDSFHRYLSGKDVEKKNWFLNRDGNLFYFYYVKDNKKHMIIIEPSEEMVDMIRKYVQQGVYQG